MTTRRKVLSTLLMLFSAAALAEPPVDTIPRSLSLPAIYPDSWIFMHDLNYFNQINGKFIIVDLAAEYAEHKGAFPGAQLANFVESERRSELYVTETVYSRGTRGERTDVLTIYEKVALTPIAEVILPANKRALMMPEKGAMQLTGDDKFLLIFNFTPASSVTIVDLDKRSVVNDVPIPGCSLNFASGKRGFFALCANGTLVSFALTDKGQVSGENVSAAFNDLDDDVLALHPTVIDGVTYFVTWHGHVRPIDTTVDEPKVQPYWPLATHEEAKSWKPADGQSLASDSTGRLFILMSSQAPGLQDRHLSEVWVFDAKHQKRLKRVLLQEEGVGIEVTRGSKPWLAVVTKNGIDVYDVEASKYVRTIGGWNSWTPIRLHASK